jgi:fumarylacetoacetase
LLQYRIFKQEDYAKSLQGVFLQVCNSSLVSNHDQHGRHERIAAKYLWCQQPVLNEFAALPIAVRQYVRQTLIENLSNSESPLFTHHQLQSEALLPLNEGDMHLPMKLTDYTDFYTSVVHAETASIKDDEIRSDISHYRLIE